MKHTHSFYSHSFAEERRVYNSHSPEPAPTAPASSPAEGGDTEMQNMFARANRVRERILNMSTLCAQRGNQDLANKWNGYLHTFNAQLDGLTAQQLETLLNGYENEIYTREQSSAIPQQKSEEQAANAPKTVTIKPTDTVFIQFDSYHNPIQITPQTTQFGNLNGNDYQVDRPYGKNSLTIQTKGLGYSYSVNGAPWKRVNVVQAMQTPSGTTFRSYSLEQAADSPPQPKAPPEVKTKTARDSGEESEASFPEITDFIELYGDYKGEIPEIASTSLKEVARQASENNFYLLGKKNSNILSVRKDPGDVKGLVYGTVIIGEGEWEKKLEKVLTFAIKNKNVQSINLLDAKKLETSMRLITAEKDPEKQLKGLNDLAERIKLLKQEGNPKENSAIQKIAQELNIQEQALREKMFKKFEKDVIKQINMVLQEIKKLDIKTYADYVLIRLTELQGRLEKFKKTAIKKFKMPETTSFAEAQSKEINGMIGLLIM